MVFFNPKITMKYSISQAIFLHLLAYDYANDYECYPREEWDAITNVWVGFATSSRWLSGESSGIITRRYIKGGFRTLAER